MRTSSPPNAGESLRFVFFFRVNFIGMESTHRYIHPFKVHGQGLPWWSSGTHALLHGAQLGN